MKNNGGLAVVRKLPGEASSLPCCRSEYYQAGARKPLFPRHHDESKKKAPRSDRMIQNYTDIQPY
jgi:hypothetical protein